MEYTLSLEEAEAVLSTVVEYGYFLNNPAPWWTAREVAEGLGIGVTIVHGWCEDHLILGATRYAGAAGWRIPRSSLIRYLAQRYIEMQEQARARNEHG